MNLKSYFRSSGYLTEQTINTQSGDDLDLNSLPAFLRTLLVTDGTVTKSLEAWFWEPVTVDVLNNELITLSSSIDGLEVEAGDRVLQREVALRGTHTNKLFASAESCVSLKHLSKEVAEALGKEKIGIGGLLREKGVETYRDIFNIDYITQDKKNSQLTLMLEGDVISRSYRIRVNRHPAIIVTEHFPIGQYES